MEQPRSYMQVGGSAAANRHVERGKDFILLVALVAIAFGRRRVGYMNLTYSNIFKAAGLMLFCNWLFNMMLFVWLFGYSISKGDHKSLAQFALAFVVLALILRHRRKLEKLDASRPHSHSLGESWIADFMPLEEKYVYLYVEPSLVLLVGALARYRMHMPLLGFYLMASAVCFFLVQRQQFTQMEADLWAKGDMGMEARYDAEVMKTMNGQVNANDAPRSTYGIPTGIDGLRGPIENRRRERRDGEENDGLAEVSK
jgi:positive regulator of sigma E activity